MLTFEQRVALRKAELEAEDKARQSMPPPSLADKARDRRERAELSQALADWHVRMERILERGVRR